VKIRCRKRRMSSSAARQSTACQSRGSSSGPFTTATTAIVACAPPVVCVAMVSNLPFGSGVIVSSSPQAHLTRVSTPSGPGTRPVSGQLSETTGGGADHTVPDFLSPFGRQAFASRVIPYPPGDWAFLTVGLPDTRSCPDPDGVTTFHAHKQRPGWVPPIPRGLRCSPGRYRISDRRLPLFHGQPLHPAQTTHQRG